MIPLLSGTYPIPPQWLGEKVAFLEALTDPDRRYEAWLAFGGTLSLADPANGVVPRLDTTPNARTLVPNPNLGNSTQLDVRLTTLARSTRILTQHGAQPTLGMTIKRRDCTFTR